MPQEKQCWVISYDIGSDRRRRNVEKILKRYGQRANYSVFECWLKKDAFTSFQAKIEEIVDGEKDSVLYYCLCRACREKRQETGFRRDRSKGSNTLII
ncbi:MAG: CRISPR-associated endonuclease Cas2 [Deltaproteobacteria bacterium]|nr:MAG: CRISPR-associated endonuclease Cas2 [Deltaproteobacteria bacterium]